MTQSFDLIVIGGGPGGYVAAIRASQLGMKVALVEKENLGGTCLNWGCIPTKALLKTAELYHSLHRLEEFGLSASNISFDIQKVVRRSRDISQKLSAGIAHLMKKNKITVFQGTARLLGGKKIDVTKVGTLTAPYIILATGAKPRILPGLEPDGKIVWTSKEAMLPSFFPKRLLVIGSGAIGVEFASFYHTMGAQVTILEIQDRILPVEDREISLLARKAFEKKGMKIHTSSAFQSLDKKGNTVTANFSADGKNHALEVDAILVAAGIQGNVDNLGLDKTKARIEKSQIQTNEWSATDEPGLYAIGDVAGAPWLAHKASHEAIICVEKIKGLPGVHPLDKNRIPGCTYSVPQIASIGLSEEAALAKGPIRIGRFPYMANGKALALGESEGLIKTIFDEKTGELLGAHLIGAEVTELVQGFSIAKTLETTEKELMETIFPHPTLSEMMHESVLDAFKQAIHF